MPKKLAAAAAAGIWLAALAGAAAGTWHLARVQPPLAAYAGPGDASRGSGGPAAERVTIVLAQGLTWADLGRLPGSSGAKAAALLTPPPTGGRADAAYLTVGAGVPAAVPDLPVPPLDRDAPWWDADAGTLHRRLTGAETDRAAVVVPGLARLAAANKDRSPPVTPGWLGEALSRAGLRTAVLGEADFAGGYDGRSAALLAMDGAGTVVYGRLEGMTRADPTAPGGTVQDWTAMVEAWTLLPPDAALVVIESGDLRRLEAAAPLLSPARWLEARQQALDRLAQGVARLLDAAAQRAGRHPVWVLAAAPAQGPAEARFGVLWIWPDEGDEGSVQPGGAATAAAGAGETALLTSPSTRRWGVVPLTDLAPAILNELGVAGPAPLGRALTAGLETYPWSRLGAAGAALEGVLGANHADRVRLIQGYVFSLIGMALAVLAAVRWRDLGRWVAWAAPGMASVPLAFLLLPGLGVQGLLPRAVITGILAAAAALWAAGRPSTQVFSWIAGLTAGVVIGDLLLGGPAVIRSPLGHSLLVGARYYGIGNEYGGLLIGASALAGGLLAGSPRVRAAGLPPWAGALAPALMGAVLLHPALGANFGCGLAAATAAGAFALKSLEGRPHRRRAVAVLAAGAAGAVAAAVVLDMAGGLAASHIGRAAQQAAAGDWQAVIDVIRRKGLLNWRLIQYTIWSRVFVATLVAVTVLVLRPAAGLRRLSQREPVLFAGIVAAVIGAGAALVLNDSGVVAAATTMVLPTTLAAHALLSPPPPAGS